MLNQRPSVNAKNLKRNKCSGTFLQHRNYETLKIHRNEKKKRQSGEKGTEE